MYHAVSCCFLIRLFHEFLIHFWRELLSWAYIIFIRLFVVFFCTNNQHNYAVLLAIVGNNSCHFCFYVDILNNALASSCVKCLSLKYVLHILSSYIFIYSFTCEHFSFSLYLFFGNFWFIIFVHNSHLFHLLCTSLSLFGHFTFVFFPF